MKKLWDCLELVGCPESPVCGLEAALSQTLCVEGLHASAPAILGFAADRVRRVDKTGHDRTWVEGLDEELRLCYERNRLPSEAGFSWARPGRLIDLGGRLRG
jgi:hypothetical protein